MKFTLKITPHINPRTRHRIQAVLEADGYIILGGGSTVSGKFEETQSDITFEREDPRDNKSTGMFGWMFA